jgi:DNA-directed RNA polymerase subunit D
MEIITLSQDNKAGKASLIIKDTTPAFVNALRRNIVDKVPTMAIELVEFRKNSSVLYDEIVAHRLGFLPLKTDLKTYNLPSECKCNGAGCARCQTKFTLSSKAQGYVYAESMTSTDPKVVPVHPNTPIVKLFKVKENQEIEFEATAVLGIGKNHMKWSPGLAFYKYLPQIEIKGTIDSPEKVAASCPKKIFEVKNNKLQLIKDKANDCDLCEACVDASNGAIHLNESDKDFIFYIESWGQLSVKEMLTKAIEAFDTQVDEFHEKLKALKI